MQTRVVLICLSLAGFTLLFLLHTTAADEKLGICFSKITRRTKACRAAMKGKKFTYEDCCLKNNSAGWSHKKRDRRSCKACSDLSVVSSRWGLWTPFTKCPVTCGVGVQLRTRPCIKKSPKDRDCIGSKRETKKCTHPKIPNCPIDGGWSDWSDWGACSKTCEQGLKVRRRTCTNPVPQYGGKMCQGNPNEFGNCILKVHCPIDGGWGPFGPWSECSRTCGLGNKTRSRKCDAPKPQYGGIPCKKSEAVEVAFCRLQYKCPRVDVGVSSGAGSGAGLESSGFKSGSGAGSGGSGGESGDAEWKTAASIRKRAAGFSDDEDY